MFNKAKRLPVVDSEEHQELAYLELLSFVYEGSSIDPIAYAIEEDESRDYLAQKYVDQVQLLMLDVKGEVVIPLLGLFDCSMFALNYRKFYT